MIEPGGWLWAILGVFGIGGLAVAPAYGSVMWSRRRKDWAMRQAQNEAVCDNYRHGGSPRQRDGTRRRVQQFPLCSGPSRSVGAGRPTVKLGGFHGELRQG